MTVNRPQTNLDQLAETQAAPTIALDHPEVIRALEDYETALQSGQRPNRHALLQKYNGISDELEECLEGIEMLHASGAVGSPKPAGPARGDDLSGQPLGDYQLLREIGRGGMGVVYEADQLSLGRRVALKVLPLAATLDPRQLQRFKNEAQAAACLHHPNIVPVYAVGCERGVHFYAMQYIEGRSLAVPIREMRKHRGLQVDDSVDAVAETVAAGKPTGENNADFRLRPQKKERQSETMRGLDTEKSHEDSHYLKNIARLGKQAAEALDHAHHLGVVHRDIKPANLLVDADSRVWITDFGLARLETNAELTMSGDLIGTLRYMSPEQALAKRGVVDHRTDIYSLGATLYELLTLEPIFDGKDRQEILNQISNEEPRPLRRFNKAVPVDLETIVLKALSKRPEERYATAQEMADDLQRFLKNQPIHARRPSIATRVSRWARRHRSLMISAVALLAFAALGLGITTLRVWQEQRKTRAAYDAEAEQRAVAQSNFHQARKMLDFFTKRIDEDLAGVPEAAEVRRKLLEKSLAYYQDFIKKSKNDPAMQEELSASHFHVAAILDEMGDEQQSQAAMLRAFKLQETLVRNNPANETLRQDLKEMYKRWGMIKSHGLIRLLGEKAVQTELNLTPDQQQTISKMSGRHTAFFWVNRKRHFSDREKLMKEFDELTKTTTKQFAEMLSTDQITRLNQISMQQQGARAFQDKEVAAHLQLTPDQRAKINSLLSRKRFHSHGGRRPRGGFGPPWARSSSDEDLDNVLAVLTPKQKTAYDEMIGERFDGRIGFASHKPMFGGFGGFGGKFGRSPFGRGGKGGPRPPRGRGGDGRDGRDGKSRPPRPPGFRDERGQPRLPKFRSGGSPQRPGAIPDDPNQTPPGGSPIPPGVNPEPIPLGGSPIPPGVNPDRTDPRSPGSRGGVPRRPSPRRRSED